MTTVQEWAQKMNKVVERQDKLIRKQITLIDDMQKYNNNLYSIIQFLLEETKELDDDLDTRISRIRKVEGMLSNYNNPFYEADNEIAAMQKEQEDQLSDRTYLPST